MHEPTHPGAVLREDVLPALGVSINADARELGITRQTLHRMLQETTSITPEMAIRFGKYCGNEPDIWLRLQGAYDLWHAERKLQKVVKAIPDRSRKAA
jgi:addiction module HigA family antidote